MKLLVLSLLLGPLTGCAITDNTYVKVGAGYKFNESDITWEDEAATHPVSTRLELGKRLGNWRYGLMHRSQWFTGWPVNSDVEYSVNEVFIDYTFELGARP
ncbi:hypothetical protein [Bowmanella dokdonensis]|uniref:Lipoprotein n=1 Tax=Bowmanella dokdonensis TaxID=751969 RepID=A0A939DL65_9ALTE|nr:hypothetical protein [Bowmanella dokdonensis]MBN7824749.1 hypothetical protein [Bowmanella dokdonensis]